MKKILLVVVAVVVIASGAALILTRKDKTNESLASIDSTNYATINACDVLTSGVAEQILGGSAVKGTLGTGQTSSDDIVFDTCIYTAGPDASPPHTTSVAVRSAKTSDGADSNKAMFTASGKPAGAQDVAGYGDTAYWDASLGQLDILKGNNWYIVSNYTGTSPANGIATLTQAEELAKLIKLQ